jgi:adenylylsulfate kinase
MFECGTIFCLVWHTNLFYWSVIVQKTTIYFSPEYKPSDPEGMAKLKADLRASCLEEGFSINSKGKRPGNNVAELLVCARSRKEMSKKEDGKRQRTSKGCCGFRFTIHQHAEYDRFFIRGGTGDPHHTGHGRDYYAGTKRNKTERVIVRDPYWPPLQVSREMRWTDHSGAVIWLTGLSGAGKTTIANEAEYILNHEKRMHTYILDEDEMRKGLCRDLGDDRMARKELVRRVGEVARIMADAGNVVLCSFVSPHRVDRDFVKLTCEANRITFFEVFVKADLEVCERRDPKGLYVKAKAGLIQGIPGLDSPYEDPQSPDLILDSGAKKAHARNLARDLVSWIEMTKRLEFPGQDLDRKPAPTVTAESMATFRTKRSAEDAELDESADDIADAVVASI